MRPLAGIIMTAVFALVPQALSAQGAQKWVVSWAASVQGPYPVGNPSAQPDQRFAFPSPETGARDQTFRLIVRPGHLGPAGAAALLQCARHQAGHLRRRLCRPAARRPGPDARARNRPVTFGGKDSVTVAPGASVWSDPVALPFVRDPAAPELAGRKLAVSFHVVGESGPMTWHAKALTTSYVTAPGAGAQGRSRRTRRRSRSAPPPGSSSTRST